MKRKLLLFVAFVGLLSSCNINHVVYNQPNFEKYLNKVDYSTFKDEAIKMMDKLSFLDDEEDVSLTSNIKTSSYETSKTRRNGKDISSSETTSLATIDSKYDSSNNVVIKKNQSESNYEINRSSENGKSHVNYYFSSDEDFEAQKYVSQNNKTVMIVLDKENKTYKTSTTDTLKGYALNESSSILDDVFTFDEEELNNSTFFVDDNIFTCITDTSNTDDYLYSDKVVGTKNKTENYVYQVIINKDEIKINMEAKKETITSFTADNGSNKSGDKITTSTRESAVCAIKKENVSLSKTSLSNYKEQ